jgi:hypothetical protein
VQIAKNKQLKNIKNFKYAVNHEKIIQILKIKSLKI